MMIGFCPVLGDLDVQVELRLGADDAVDRRAQLLLDTHEMLGLVPDDDRLLRITLHIDRDKHARLAVIHPPALVVARVFDPVDDDDE